MAVGRRKSEVNDDRREYDPLDDMIGEIDIDELVASIHSAELVEPDSWRRRNRVTRARMDQLENKRSMRDELPDWDFEDYYDYSDYDEH